MQLHVIHLKHRKDRLKSILEELQTQNVGNYVFWEGIQDHEKPSRGIAKAHQQIVAWAYEQGMPEVLIAEDDVHFSAPGALEYFISNKPTEYDLYLGGISYGKLNIDNSIDDFAGTHLYLIRQQFYKRFLSLTGEKDIDRALARQGRFFVCNPMIALQWNGFSDNKKEYLSNDLYFRNRNLWKGDSILL